MHRSDAVTKGLISGSISALLALLAVGCGGTSVTELAGPGAVRCQTSLGTPAPTVPATGGRVDVTVSAARECSWTSSSEVSWIQVSPSSGQGEMTMTLTVAANPQGLTRNGAVVVNDQRYTVAQAAAPCRYTLSSSNEEVDAAGGNMTVGVSTIAGCTWTATSNQAWVRVLTPSGTGQGTVNLAVSPNSGGVRSASIAIAGQTFTVTQAAPRLDPAPAPSPTPGPSPTPAPGTPTPTPTPAPTPTPTPTPEPTPTPTPTPTPVCTFSIDPRDKTFNRDGGDGAIRVTTLATCTWSAASSVDWITVASTETRTGSGSVDYTVSSYRGNGDRTGTIAVAGQTFTVTQKGDKKSDSELP
jgi:hypothetical protein